ncbi:AraC family transcriptional regulator [Pigmentiphaga sp. H8]|uniref:helix-turn-helix domain-containing protein n=1 Tax=Pigmentiphaga sp. H8 TaxID=2488560 RepID=UPI000F595999|nr:AraC family transcriptional regulator [Pigmentiphaga sp. H8]AZG11141.1 AraC family transcriptional regulator [Pigmentiphaga sp. H8]
MSRVLAVTQGHIGRACLLDKVRPAGAHAHPVHHAMIELDGPCHEYQVGEASAVLAPRRAVLVNSHELHANLSVGQGKSTILMLYFSPLWIEEQFPGLPAYVRFFRHGSVQLGADTVELAQHLARRMLEAAEINTADVQALFGELAEHLCHQYGPTYPNRERPARSNDYRIRRAIALMQEHLEEPLPTQEIAARVGLSRSRFFELFTACTGLSPKHYVNMLRLHAAVEYLADDPGPIAELSQRCGFGAQSHFSKFFVDQQGFTPRDYRRAAVPALPRQHGQADAVHP